MNRKKIYIISAAIAILIILVGSIYFFFYKKNTNVPNKQQIIDFLNSQPKSSFTDKQKVDIVKTLSAPANGGSAVGLTIEQKLKLMQASSK